MFAFVSRAAEPTGEAQPAKESCKLVVQAPPTLPEGPGMFSATVTVERVSGAGSGPVSLVSSLSHRDGRVFWLQESKLAPDAADKAVVKLDVPHPDLPPGQYFLNNILKDGSGQAMAELPDVVDAIAEGLFPGSRAQQKKPPLPTAAVRTPIGRMQSYLDLGRELLWGFWTGEGYGDLKNYPKMVEIGFNMGGGYQFPYRWRYNQHDFSQMVAWPEDILKGKMETWGIGMDPGFVVFDQWDERGMIPWADPELVRRDKIRLLRLPKAWPSPMPTIAEYNRRSGNDCLSWDEVERDGFPDHGQEKNTVEWSFWQALQYDHIGLRIESGRRENPYVNHSTGMGAGCDQHFFDSMHARIYAASATVEALSHFLQGVPRYGAIRPWTWLVNVDNPAGRAEHVKRIMWIAVAAGGRCMPFFELTRSLVEQGTVPQKGELGDLTPEGRWAAETIARIQPLSPVLMSVRNRLNPEVLLWDPGYYLPNDGVLEGLLANGVQPEVNNLVNGPTLRANGVQEEAGRKLIILDGSSFGGQDYTPMRRAVEAGACLFMTAEVDNGGNAPKAFGLTMTGLADLVLEEGATSLPKEFNKVVHRRVEAAEREIDLTPLNEFVPGLTGLTIKAQPGPLGELAADSPLKRVLAKDRTTLGYVGKVGKGQVVILNAHLPGPGIPPNQARNRVAHGALMGAVLKWAGVQGAFRCTDPGSNQIYQDALAIEVATPDATQSYAIVIPEYDADLAFRPADPAVRAVRDLCAGTILPWKQDAHGRYVQVTLKVGNGTMLSLVKSDPAAELAITPAVLGAAVPAKEMAGGQTLYLGVSRQTGGAPIADAHTFRVTAQGPDGQAIRGFTEWGTGAGPVVIKLPVAVTDPDGTWTIEVQDLTDGATGKATITKRKGHQPDKPGAQPGALAAALGVKPVPYTLEMESVPRIEGDIIIATIRGKLRSTVDGEQEAVVTIGMPAETLLSGTTRIPLRVRGGQATPFELTFCMHRDQFLTVYNGVDYAREQVQIGLIRMVNNEGIRVRAEIGGKTVAQTKWTVDIMRWLRKPNPLGTLTGGEIHVLVQNLSDKDRQVELSCAGLPGWAGKGLQVSQQVPAGELVTVKQAVTWADSAKADPGYHWLPMAVKVDGKPFDGATIFVDEEPEQIWWTRFQPATDATNSPPGLPAEPGQAASAGWTNLTCQSVIWGVSVSGLLSGKGPNAAGAILAGACVNAPTAREAKVGFVGSKPPSRIWVNDQLVEGDWGGMKGGGVGAKPAAFRKGVNVVVMEVALPLKLHRPGPYQYGGPFLADGLAVVLQDPKTGKRDRDLVVGAR
jgi:hypothetical protein